MFADIVLPLAVPGAYTYALPQTMEGFVDIGSRVVVPLGKSKRYTGIVIRLHNNAPQLKAEKIKSIEELVDAQPLLLENQIRLWRWLADYYMCYPGEVMKAALPAGLKLESETLFALHPDVDAHDPEIPQSETERRILQALAAKAKPLTDLRKEAAAVGVVSALKRLVEAGIVEVEERVSQAFKSKTEIHLRLHPDYHSQDALNALFSSLRRSPRQAELLTAFLDLATATADAPLPLQLSTLRTKRSDLHERIGTSMPAALSGLLKKGVLLSENVEVARLKTHTAVPHLLERPLSTAQQEAHDAILAAFRQKAVVLLKGVTSSGKTEIYAKLIRKTIAEGKQVLFLLPEIALTTQITTRLGKLFGDQLGIYHSKFPDNERVELWKRQLSANPFPLILGVRSALFLPFQRLGLIIVDEEHETSYKQQDPAPRYHARDTAILMAAQQGAKVLLGTATPSLETYTHALNGKYGLVRLDTRYGDVRLPEIIVEDLAELRRKRLLTSPFSPRLKEETEAALARGEQAIFFLNRRGYSPVLQCRSCGWTPTCQRCDVSLTLHQKIGRLVCHYCGTQYDIPHHCPQCNETDLRDIGAGTEKIEAAVEASFPTAKTSRMDLDTTRSRSAYEAIIRDFQQRRTNLLVGTQMVTKGLDFDGVSLVGILNADQMLNQCDFRAHERAFQMMTQVAGRAGRRNTQGRVVLQTRQPDLPLISHIVRGDYDAMYHAEVADRRAFRYPPEVRIIHIFLKHRDERKAATAARLLADELRPHFANDLLGPDRPAVAFVQMLHIRKILLKVSPHFTPASVRATLLSLRARLLSVPQLKGLTVYFDVDPM